MHLKERLFIMLHKRIFMVLLILLLLIEWFADGEKVTDKAINVTIGEKYVKVHIEAKSVKVEDKSVKVEDKGVKVEDKGVKVEDKGVKVKEKGRKVEDKDVKVEDSGIKVEDKGIKAKAIARITKGTRAQLADYPHSVEFFNQDIMCGGSIITSRSILTAAHCLDDYADAQYMAITYGAAGSYITSPNQNTVPIWDFKIHYKYKEGEIHNDIAMLFLDKHIKFSDVTQRAFLVDTDIRNPKAKYTVIGWGLTTYPNGTSSHNGLQMAYMRFEQKLECERKCNVKLPPEIFCLSGGDGKNTCDGDSGNGVLWSGMLTGIVGYGMGCGSEPTFFTSIYQYIEWIEDAIMQNQRKICFKKNGR